MDAMWRRWHDMWRSDRCGAGAGEDSDKVKQDLLDSKSANFPEGHNTEPWHEHLAQSTPGAFSKPSGTVSEWASGLDCRDPTAVVVAADKLAPGR